MQSGAGVEMFQGISLIVLNRCNGLHIRAGIPNHDPAKPLKLKGRNCTAQLACCVLCIKADSVFDPRRST
jgi:hypothetical protein